jgi:hypothetical protein
VRERGVKAGLILGGGGSFKKKKNTNTKQEPNKTRNRYNKKSNT